MAIKKISDFQIYQKYMDMIFYSNDLLMKYPKSEKFALVQEIKNDLYAIKGRRKIFESEIFSPSQNFKKNEQMMDVPLVHLL